MKLSQIGTIIGVCTGVIALGGFAWSVIQEVATKEYHDETLTPLVKSVENIEASAVVTRIRGLYRSRCGSSWNPDLQDLLDAQLKRYRELTDREFRPGECRDGVWYTASGVPG